MKTIVYRMRGGTTEYNTTPDKWEAMIKKHGARGFEKVREDDTKEVRTAAPAEVGKVENVAPGPKRGKAGSDTARPPSTKEVRKGDRVEKAIEKEPTAVKGDQK